eukprot:m.44689 g.44689  ORF g.44689 m.44689 type:complete len:489 (-) comp12122_c0_seq5:134-1600(-)
MHVSISGVEEKYEDAAAKTGKHHRYIIHINGSLHCTLRFSQLHELHTSLKAKYGSLTPPFPSKKLLALTPAEVKERMKQLETYLQAITQHPGLARSSIISDFFSRAQEEVQIYCEEATLEIHLVNGKTMTLNCLSTDQTDDVLEDTCKELGLKEDFTFYFALYLMTSDLKRTIRRLQDFETPVISLQRAGPGHVIQLRKAYLNPVVEKDLLQDDIALNLAYIQAAQELKNGALMCKPEYMAKIKAAKASKSKPNFLEACQRLRTYNNVLVEGCVSDFPKEKTIVTAVVVFDSLRLRTETPRCEYKFPITRIRCWKVTGTGEHGLSLSFHYQNEAQELAWIKLDTPDAIHLSMTLQLAVDELLRLRKNEPMRTPSSRARKPKPELKPKPEDFTPRISAPISSTLVAKDSDATEESDGQQSITTPVPTETLPSSPAKKSSKDSSLKSTPRKAGSKTKRNLSKAALDTGFNEAFGLHQEEGVVGVIGDDDL